MYDYKSPTIISEISLLQLLSFLKFFNKTPRNWYKIGHKTIRKCNKLLPWVSHAPRDIKLTNDLNTKEIFLFNHVQMRAAGKIKGRECKDKSQSKKILSTEFRNVTASWYAAMHTKNFWARKITTLRHPPLSLSLARRQLMHIRFNRLLVEFQRLNIYQVERNFVSCKKDSQDALYSIYINMRSWYFSFDTYIYILYMQSAVNRAVIFSCKMCGKSLKTFFLSTNFST